MNDEKKPKENGENKDDIKEKEKVIREINEPGEKNPTSERTQNPNYK